MPLTKIQFAPGIDKQNTEYGAEGRWTDSDMVRFRYGLPEKIGGWIKLISQTLVGVVRDMHAWSDLDGIRYMALGTDRKLYVYSEGAAYDITPIRATQTGLSNPFATASGSAIVTVTDSAHGAQTGDFVTFTSTAPIAGLDMNKEFEITAYVNTDTYTVTYTGSTANATVAAGGGTVTAAYQISIGLANSAYGYGWGTGAWNVGTWNTPRSTSTVKIEAREWSFDNFGEDLLATVSEGGTYRWDTSVGSGTRAAIISQAPTSSRFNLVSPTDRHVFLFGTETTIGSTSTTDPLFLRWSSQEDYTTWTPTAVNTAGSFRIQDGSKIMAATRSRGAILVWTDTSLHGMQFVGPPFTFSLSQIGANCGAVSNHCVKDVNGITYWMSQNSFFAFDGAVKKIPCSVQDYVFSDFNITTQPETYCGLNSEKNEITWFYCSLNAQQIDRYVTLNYLEQSWSIGTMARTSWVDYGVYENPYATEYSTSAIATTPSVLGLTAGASTFYVQESGFDADGSPLVAYVTSGDFDIQDGQHLLHIGRGIPDFQNLANTVDVSLKFKTYPASSSSITKTSTISTTTTKFDIRGRGRQGQLTIQSDALGDNWRFGTLRLDVQPDGGR
tara:strand:- start:346 stop:2181 length:1836 start_codon:yes stop_codon:yes gene_type:complete